MVKLFKVASFRNSIIKGLLFLFSLFLFNIFFNRFFTRFDFTQEKRFTLSPVSIKVLNQIHKPLNITIYLEGNFPAPFKHLQQSIKETLNEFSVYSHGNLRYKFINPLAGKDTTLRDSLSSMGIEPTQIQSKTEGGASQKEIFPGALIQMGSRILAIGLLQNQNQLGTPLSSENLLNHSEENLEYAFIDAIYKLEEKEPSTIGFLDGNGEVFNPKIADLIKTLKTSYGIVRIDLQKSPLDSLVRLDAILLIKPEIRFTEAQKYKLDQYIMHGGKILAFIDNVNAEMDSMGKNGTTLGFPKDLNLDDFLFRMGIRINYNLIRDLNCAPIPIVTDKGGINSNQNLEPWVYYPLVMPLGTNPIIKNLDPVRLEFASTIDTIGIKGLIKTFLLGTSPYTRVVATPVRISLDEIADVGGEPNNFQGGVQNVAVLNEGTFHSSFLNRHFEGMDTTLAFRAQSEKNKLIVVADGNLPLNQINSLEKSIYPLGYDKYSRQVFGNKVFVENAINYLVDTSGLISLRSKDIRLRILNKTLVEDKKSYETITNFIFPILFVLIIGFSFAAFRSFWFTKA